MNPEHSEKLKNKIPKKMSFWAKQGSARSIRAQDLVGRKVITGFLDGDAYRGVGCSTRGIYQEALRRAEGEQLKGKARVVVSWCPACGDKSPGTQH